MSDVMVMNLKVNLSPNTSVRVTQKQYNKDMLGLLKVAVAEHYAHLAVEPHSTLKGLDRDQEINPDHPPKNYKMPGTEAWYRSGSVVQKHGR